MTVQVWSNVAIAVQSAISATQTVTGITKANPAVVTYSGADTFANADYILITAQGMSQVDGRIFRVANVSTGSNTLELEGCDSSAYDTFSSGSVQLITFGTSLTVASNVSVSGGDFQFIDVTTIHDTVQKQIPGNASPTTFSLDCQWQPDDAGLIALKAASDAKAIRAVRITFSNGYKYLVTGYVGATLSPTGSAQQVVTTPVVLTAFGRPTTYAT
jgi:hypothetical protein